MTPIRPLEPEDLPEVAGLYERTVRSGSSTPAPGLLEHFERMLDHPWADPEIPSLVYADDDGRIVGFLASYPRRVKIAGRDGRLACSGQLVADEGSRNRAVGALLTRTYLGGPQDLTITDGATELVRRIWGQLGGVTAQLRSIDWVKVLHPASLGTERLLDSRGDTAGGRALRRLAAGSDAVIKRVAPRHLAIGDPGEVTAEPLTPELVLEHLAALLPRSLRLRPAYDIAYLRWLFGELPAIRTRGRLAATLLRASDECVLGWYVAFIPRHGRALTLQVAARERDAGTVLDHLMQAARDGGASAVHGRVEPQLMDSLAERGVLLHHAGSALAHAVDPAAAALASSSQSMLTLLDGEYWMEHHEL